MKRDGIATVEFALILPILMLLFIGMLEFGQLIRIKQKVTTASFVATRYAVAADSEEPDLTTVKLTANAAYWGLKNPDEGLSWENIDCPDREALRVEPTDLSAPTGQPVRVDVSIDFRAAAWRPMLGRLVPSAIKAFTVMRKEPRLPRIGVEL